MIRLAGMFLVLALSVMSAETYWLQIYGPVFLGGNGVEDRRIHSWISRATI